MNFIASSVIGSGAASCAANPMTRERAAIRQRRKIIFDARRHCEPQAKQSTSAGSTRSSTSSSAPAAARLVAIGDDDHLAAEAAERRSPDAAIMGPVGRDAGGVLELRREAGPAIRRPLGPAGVFGHAEPLDLHPDQGEV